MDVENANCKLKVSQCGELDVTPVKQPIKVGQEITGLDHLIQELHRVFSNDYVNVQEVQTLMAGYKSNPSEWKKYAKFDRFKYTRNLIDEGNGAFNIMLLCWGAGHASPIHDHADSHCFMKLLDGSLEEVRYNWPQNVEPEVMKVMKSNKARTQGQSETTEMSETPKTDTCQSGSCQRDICEVSAKADSGKQCEEEEEYNAEDMEETGRTRLEVNDVCYINDALGLHRMVNPSHVDGAVSLHLYCPPFDSCRVFDARTSKPTEVKVTFWSKFGKKIQRVMDANEIADSQ